jgi:hypothetical protein
VSISGDGYCSFVTAFYSISFPYPAPSSAGHTPPDPTRPAGLTVTRSPGRPGQDHARQAPLPSSDPKRQNIITIESHLLRHLSRLDSTRLAPGPGRGRGIILQDYVTAMRPSDCLEISSIPLQKNIARAA